MAPDLRFVLILALIVLVVILLIWMMRRRTRVSGASEVDDRPPAIVSPDAARQGALRGIAQHGLDRRPDWRPLLTAPAIPLEPVLVERLDKSPGRESYYYLVPFGVDVHSVGAIAIVDALTAEFGQATPMRPKADRSWGDIADTWRNEDKVKQRAAPSSTARVTVHPRFVWKPCAESRSPYSPFRMVTVDGAIRYVRMDGEVFDKLTTLGPGGRTP